MRIIVMNEGGYEMFRIKFKFKFNILIKIIIIILIIIIIIIIIKKIIINLQSLSLKCYEVITKNKLV